MEIQDIINVVSVPIIITITYAIIDILKRIVNNNEKFMRVIPIVSAGIGALLGLIFYKVEPSLIASADSVGTALIIGAVSGLASTGSNQVIKQLKKTNDAVNATQSDEKGEDDKTDGNNGN